MVWHHYSSVLGGWVVPNGRQLFLDYTPNGSPQEPDQDDVVNFQKFLFLLSLKLSLSNDIIIDTIASLYTGWWALGLLVLSYVVEGEGKNKNGAVFLFLTSSSDMRSRLLGRRNIYGGSYEDLRRFSSKILVWMRWRCSYRRKIRENWEKMKVQV